MRGDESEIDKALRGDDAPAVANRGAVYLAVSIAAALILVGIAGWIVSPVS